LPGGSRGLGDVYKRQIDGFFTFASFCAATLPAKVKMTRENSIFFIVLNS
jgi:hypothetical protein